MLWWVYKMIIGMHVVWACEVMMFKEFQDEVLYGGILVYAMT